MRLTLVMLKFQGRRRYSASIWCFWTSKFLCRCSYIWYWQGLAWVMLTLLQFTVHCSFVALCFHTKFLLCMAALSYNLNIIYIFHHIMKVNCIFFSKPLQIHNVWKLQSIFSPLLLHICWVESKSSSNHLKF